MSLHDIEVVGELAMEAIPDNLAERPDLALEALWDAHRRIEGGLSAAAQQALRSGRWLRAMDRQLPRGWLREWLPRLPFSRATAYRYIGLAGQVDSLDGGEQRLLSLAGESLTALYREFGVVRQPEAAPKLAAEPQPALELSSPQELRALARTKWLGTLRDGQPSPNSLVGRVLAASDPYAGGESGAWQLLDSEERDLIADYLEAAAHRIRET